LVTARTLLLQAPSPPHHWSATPPPSRSTAPRPGSPAARPDLVRQPHASPQPGSRKAPTQAPTQAPTHDQTQSSPVALPPRQAAPPQLPRWQRDQDPDAPPARRRRRPSASRQALQARPRSTPPHATPAGTDAAPRYAPPGGSALRSLASAAARQSA